MEEAAKVSIDRNEALRTIRIHWLSHVVHEMRGPLFAARGYTKLLLDEKGGEVTVTQRKYLETTLENIDKIGATVESLQDFKALDELELEIVDTAELLREALADHSQEIATLHFAQQIPSGTAWTIADRAKLTCAVHKLLGVMVEFSRSGGKVEIQARREGDEFLTRMTGTLNGSNSESEASLSANLAGACRIFRLHGGVASADARHPGFFNITIRLPLVGPETATCSETKR